MTKCYHACREIKYREQKRKKGKGMREKKVGGGRREGSSVMSLLSENKKSYFSFSTDHRR